MTERVIAAVLSALAISLFSFDAQAATGKANKTSAHTTACKKNVRSRTAVQHRRSRGHRVAGLIPPPPAYMPCILPELYYRNTASGITEVAVADKKENPYSQYVKTPGGDAPEAVSSRKGVVTWNRR